MEEIHKPVLLSEVIECLDPKEGETYLDLTAGYAGHASKILAVTQNYKGATLVDRDENAINYLTKNLPGEVEIINDDFYSATQHLFECGKTFDMILADFGVSSPQLDNSERGFSFTKSGPLDMRMDPSQNLTASDIVNKWHPRELEKIFIEYGEESAGLAKKHAREIVEGRPWNDTLELANAIAFGKHVSKSKGTRWFGKHPATQVFQAIRIAVNDELGIIERTLPILPKLLNKNGRVAIITFHSLEDRLVKNYFKENSTLGEESEFELINQDHSLKSFEWCIKRRNEHFKNQLHQIETNEESLENFANSYKKMGLHLLPNNDIQYREYAPGAKGVALFGEFNNWKRDEYWAERDKYGFWNLIIPNDNGQPRIKHGTKVKSNVVLSNGSWVDRNPIWIEFLYQNPSSLIFDGVFWNPEPKYVWKYPKTHLPKPKSLRIYEAHMLHLVIMLIIFLLYLQDLELLKN